MTLSKQNHATIQQLRIFIESNEVKQEQQITNLMGTLDLLKDRINVLAPQFKQVEKLQETNHDLENRVNELVKKHANQKISGEIEASITSLQARVRELDQKIHSLSRANNHQSSVLSVMAETSKVNVNVSANANSNSAMPSLRKAFAAPRFPFILKALRSSKKKAPVTPVVCTLPPYSKM